MHLGMTGIGTKEEGPKEPPIQNNRLIRVSHKRYHDLLLDNRPSYLEYTYRMFHPISRICCIVLIISILFTFVFGLHRMGSATMQPSLQDGDLILYYRMSPRYYTNDVVMVDYHGRLDAVRVIAQAGDQVDITQEGLKINGYHAEEPKITEKTTQFQGGTSFPVNVSEGEFFVLGDHREGATDSRIYGCVKGKDIKGRVIGVFRRREF